jgi:phosphoglycerate dehydrogenase-like enzyme
MRIAVLDDWQRVALASADWGPVLQHAAVDTFADHLTDPGLLVQRLLPYDVVVVMRERTALPAEVIESLPNLRLIVTTGRVNAAIDLSAAARRHVTVSGTDSLSSAPAELTWALILGHARRLPTELANVRAGQWQTTVGLGLAGRTLGVVGLGRIGSRVAEVGAAFGMEVLAWSRALTQERARSHHARRVALEDLLRNSDVVTVHLRLTGDTRHLLDEQRIGIMKHGAFLVNTARSGLIDTEAAVRAVHTGRLAGLGLDVFDLEPLPANHPLRTTPGVIATPHLGYVSDDVYAVFFHHVVEDIVAFAGGSPVRVLG